MKPNIIMAESNEPRSQLVALLRDHLQLLQGFRIHTPEETGQIFRRSGLLGEGEILLYKAIKDGGFLQLATLVTRESCAGAIILLDPNDPWSDGIDTRALKRVCTQFRVPLITSYVAAQRWLTFEATNITTNHQYSEAAQLGILEYWKPGIRNLSSTGPKYLEPRERTLAVVAHDRQKLDLIRFVDRYAMLLGEHQRVLATGTTAWLLKLLFASDSLEHKLEERLRGSMLETRLIATLRDLAIETQIFPKSESLPTLLPLVRNAINTSQSSALAEKLIPLPSGPLGGDVIVADAILSHECHTVIFFNDPSVAAPHNDDIRLIERAVQKPGVYAECITNLPAAERWIEGLRLELDKGVRYDLHFAEDISLADEPGEIRVFISHSSQDSSVAEVLIELLISALGLKHSEIRCTSVDGYRLPVGIDTKTRLRQEILEADVFIGIVSPASLSSAYVIFELGARWGAGRFLAPVLAPGVRANILPAPLAEQNALACDNGSQLHQLIADLGRELAVTPNAPHAYQSHIDRLLGMNYDNRRRSKKRT